MILRFIVVDVHLLLGEEGDSSLTGTISEVDVKKKKKAAFPGNGFTV